MTTKARQDQYSETLYMALDLGGTTWKVGFAIGLGRKPRLVTIAARSSKALLAQVRRAKRHYGFQGAVRVLSCYEAGRDGFWLHRYLESVGIENVVVEPASVSVSRRARRAKTDRLDTEKLLRHLIRFQEDPAEWRVVRVPSVEQEDERHLHRELQSLKKERTAHTCRIKSFFALHGRKVSVRRDFLETLATLEIPVQLKERVKREFQRRVLVEAQIKELEQQRRERIRSSQTKTAQQARRMMSLRGIGETSAWQFASEMFSWRKLNNRREVGALLGLTPTPYNSDGSVREQGISKAGLRRTRALAVEIAWCWLRHQPQSELSRWFQNRFGLGRRSRKVGIVALARKLLIALWRYVERGIVPQGATLKNLA